MPEVEIREGMSGHLAWVIVNSVMSPVPRMGLPPKESRKLAGLVNDQDHPNHDANWIADDKAFYNLQIGIMVGRCE